MLSLVYDAEEQGMQWIGPFRIALGPPGTVTLQAESIMVTSGPVSSSPPASPGLMPGLVPAPMPPGPGTGRRVSGPRLRLETVQAPGPYFPGVPFRVDYYLDARSFIKDVESYWCPPRNGTARLLDEPGTTAWQVMGEGVRRARILSLEVTPAGSGELVLPVLQARVSEFGLAPWGGSGTQDVYSDTTSVQVTPFPAEGRPADFHGMVDSVAMDLEVDRPDGARVDWIARLTVTGPGRGPVSRMPEVPIRGPARLLQSRRGEADDTHWWELLVCPSDTGSVILGPDSLAWLDQGTMTYRQAVSGACTLHVDQAPVLCDSIVARCTLPSRHRSLIPAFIASTAALLSGLYFLLKWRSYRRRNRSLREAADAEEVLTAYEAALSRPLTGRARSIGADGVEEAMESACVPQLLQRQVLRNWKDLEQLLVGRSVTAEQTEAARKASIAIVEEVEKYIASRKGSQRGRQGSCPES